MRVASIDHDCDTPNNFPEEAHNSVVKMKCRVCGKKWEFHIDSRGMFRKHGGKPSRGWQRDAKRRAARALEAKDWEKRYDDEMV